MKKNVIIIGAILFLIGTYFYTNQSIPFRKNIEKSIRIDSTITPIDTNKNTIKTSDCCLPQSSSHLEKEKEKRKAIREKYLKSKLKKMPKA